MDTAKGNKMDKNQIYTTRKFNGGLKFDVIKTPKFHYNARVSDEDDKTLALTKFRDTVDEAIQDGMDEVSKILSVAH